MPKTTTRFLSFGRLHAEGASAVTVIKLMMACNDLSLANQSLSTWKNDLHPKMKARHAGAGMYFLRTQLAHLHEGLKIIEDIKKDPRLMTIVARCDGQTQQSFNNLEQFLPNAPKRGEFKHLIGRIRHNLTFHYDESGKLIDQAIADRAARPDTRTTSITRGDTAYLWHFKAADDIVDSVVVRQIWAIPHDKDIRIEADHITEQVHEIFLWFVDFSGEFIWKYCEG